MLNFPKDYISGYWYRRPQEQAIKKRENFLKKNIRYILIAKKYLMSAMFNWYCYYNLNQLLTY